MQHAHASHALVSCIVKIDVGSGSRYGLHGVGVTVRASQQAPGRFRDRVSRVSRDPGCENWMRASKNTAQRARNVHKNTQDSYTAFRENPDRYLVRAYSIS